MNAFPKVSVVTTTYNDIENLKRILAEVKKQTYPNIEHIIVDGGSTDGTVDLLKELEEKEYTAAAGGGAVTVTVSGKKEVVSIKLSEEVVDPDDVEMLQDLVLTAVNEALNKADSMMQSELGSLNIPGLF